MEIKAKTAKPVNSLNSMNTINIPAQTKTHTQNVLPCFFFLLLKQTSQDHDPVILYNPKSNDKCLYQAEIEGDLTQTEETGDPRGRDWSEAITSQGEPTVP